MSDDYISGEEHQHIKNTHTKKNTRVTISVTHIVLVGAAVVICVLSFWGGMLYQKHKSPVVVTSAAANGGASGFSGRGGFGGRRLGAIGTVSNISSTNISINDMRTGTNATYTIDSSTKITENGQSASVSNIQNGDTVIVTTSSSTSTVATRILVNPSFGGQPTMPATTGSQTTN